MKTRVGRFYWRDPVGRWHASPTPDRLEDVDHWICRRLVDYPAGQPAGSALSQCTECFAVVVYDPQAPRLDAPKVCMQCAGIEPLPFEPPP